MPTGIDTSTLAPALTDSADCDSHRETSMRIEQLLDRTSHHLGHGDTSGMDDFVLALDEARRALEPMRWRAVINDVIATHRLRPLVHQEPITRHAFEKPRGYPGDAALIDLIYREGPEAAPSTSLGARLHAWAGGRPGFASVRERRSILSTLIDRVARERAEPRILSLACGHLREAQRSDAIRQRAVRELVAVDQDPRSLTLVEREQSAFNVRPICASVRKFLVDPTIYGSFDLVYAAGLYDYLAEPIAISLTRAMFESLLPGGRLLVANFAPDLVEIGYMEAIMDWNLIYRDEPEIARFALGIPGGLMADMRVFRDTSAKVIYLAIEKA